MRRVWASVVAVWATLAIVAVLAWSNRPPPPLTPAAPVVVVKGKHGQHRLVVVQSNAAPLTTTHTSQVAAGG